MRRINKRLQVILKKAFTLPQRTIKTKKCWGTFFYARMNAKRIAKRKEPPALFFQLPSFSSSSISHSHITVPLLLHFFQLRSSFFILLSFFFVYFLMIEIHHNFFSLFFTYWSLFKFNCFHVWTSLPWFYSLEIFNSFISKDGNYLCMFLFGLLLFCILLICTCGKFIKFLYWPCGCCFYSSEGV